VLVIPAALLLRNRTASGHWFGVTATPGTLVEVFRAGGLGEREPAIGRSELGSSTGFGAGPATTGWFGLGDVDRIDVRVSRPDGSVVVLKGRAPDRLVRSAEAPQRPRGT
jgi:hypothetical protein